MIPLEAEHPGIANHAAATLSNPLRIHPGSYVVPADRLLRWYALVLEHVRLTHLEAHVLAVIFVHAKGGKDGSGKAWPAQRTIERWVGSDRRDIRNAIEKFVNIGILAATPGGPRRSTTYQMAWPRDAHTHP